MVRACAAIVLLAWLLPAAPSPASDADSTVIDREGARRRVAAARAAAGADRHHEAVADYLEALARDATLVPEVAQEIAYQKLWREDAERAVFYFRRHLARHPGADARDVRKGLALALSWSGRQPEAVALYRRLVAADPDDGDAQVGLGRSLIWDNRLHAGYGVLRGVETGPAGAAPGREAGDVLLTVLDGYTPHLELRLDASRDSDDLEIRRLAAHGAVTVTGNRLLQIMPSVARYAQPGRPDVIAPRIGLGLVTALARNWALHSYGWVENYRSDRPLFAGPDRLDWTRWGGDVWLTWLPAPRWRTDLGVASQAVETYGSLDRRLHHEQANLSLEWRLARRWRIHAAGEAADYSDGNLRRRGTAGLRWQREGKVNLKAGPALSYMDFREAYPGGYWAPDWVRSVRLEAGLATRSRRTTWRLDASVGREREAAATAITVGSVSARFGWRFAPGWLVALEGGYAKSRFASAGGYDRTRVGLALRALF